MDKKDGLRDQISDKTEEIQERISDKKEAIQERISDTKEDIQEKTSSFFKKLKRGFFMLLGTALVLGLIALAVVFFFNFSTGDRAGTLVKISKKGYIFKTYEGQLSIGSLSNDGGGIGTDIWEFTVPRGNEKVLQDLNNAIEKGHRVKLTYNEKLMQFSILGDTKYFIKEVEIVKD